MEDPMETASESSEPLTVDSIRSRLRELSVSAIGSSFNGCSSGEFAGDFQKFLRDSALEIESKIQQVVEEYSDGALLGIADLDSYVEHLKQELSDVEAQSSKIAEEIEQLSRNHLEESIRLESNLEEINCSLDFMGLQLAKGVEDASIDCSTEKLENPNLMNADMEQELQILELDSRIEMNRSTLKSLEDLDLVSKRLNVLEQMEATFTGLKVIDIDGNCIRLSLQTYIPTLEGFYKGQRFEDSAAKSVVNHELLIEIVDESMELMNIEMFPNDVYIGDIVDEAKSYRQLFLILSVLETRSPLLWFLGKFQDRIILSTLRKNVVKVASTARHSVEYVENDEMIVAHMIGEIDAFIKIGQGWPLLSSPLKLISVKNSNNHSKGVSLSLLCKVEERVNSLDAHTRQNLSSFMDQVEKSLVEQMRLELNT